MMLTVDWDERGQDSQVSLLQNISSKLAGSRKIVAITGAGISVSAGIPDFRSAEGLYTRVLSAPDGTSSTRQTAKSAKGKDFFDASFFATLETRPLFNRFVAELRDLCAQGSPTPTHLFLRGLASDQRLLRWYTQNIDGLEKACGLRTSTCITEDQKSTLRGHHNIAPVVSLHGTLDRLVCTLCKSLSPFTDSHKQAFKQGESPVCEKCTIFCQNRQACGRRAVKCGILRPDIVLYNEPHPQGETIAEVLHNDLNRRPTVLLVMGTSLKVVGLKKMVKDLARAVRTQPDGLIVFINKTPAAHSEWKTIFDYELIGECDNWVGMLENTIKPVSIPQTPRINLLFPPSPLPNAMPFPKKDGRIDRMFKVARKLNSPALETKDGKGRELAAKDMTSPVEQPKSPTLRRPARVLRSNSCIVSTL